MYMARVGHPVPPQYNPADHILFFVQSKSEADCAAFVDFWAEQEKEAVIADILPRRTSASQVEMPNMARKRSSLVQLHHLVVREFRLTMRDTPSLIMRFAVSAVMGALFACIFKGVGGKDAEPGGLQSHFGAICNIMTGAMFSSTQPVLLLFPFERPIFLREYASNMYGSVPYFLAKMAIELPVAMLTSIETLLVAHWIMELKGNFFGLVLAHWGLSGAGASTALFVGCSLKDVRAVQEVSILTIAPQIIFCGIFISINLIPSWLRWLQYACSLKYAINLGVLVEFANIPEGRALLDFQDIHEDKWLMYVGVLAGIFCFFRLLALVCLRQKAQFVC